MSDNKRKPVIGEKLFLLKSDRRSIETSTVTVTSSGPKYFKAHVDGMSEWHTIQFHQGSWREKTQYSNTYTLYETEKEYKDEQEYSNLKSKIYRSFDCWSKHNFTLEQLRAVDAILFPEIKPTEGSV
jgi:hypothetical protein